MPKIKQIKPLESYGAVSDEGIVTTGTAVSTGCTNNTNFPNMPVSAADLKTNVDSLSALIAEAADGSRKVIAQRNKQREVVIKMLRLDGRYVEVTSNGDMAIFMSSGFTPASNTKASPQPLPAPVIKKVAHGPNTGQLTVQIKALPKATSYDVRYGAAAAGTVPATWITQLVTAVKPAPVISGLTSGLNYAVQARATGKAGYSDWSDSANCICT
jgi:hypothetical protein